MSGNKEQPHIVAVADAFREKQLTVVRFDSTNTFGESDGAYEDMTVTGYLEDLEDVISWSKTQRWYQEPFCLAGHSIGGLVSMLYSQRHPQLVKAFAPISTVVSGMFTKQTAWLVDVIDTWGKTGFLVEESATRPGLIKKLKWAFMKDLLQHNALSRADRLTMPTLLMVGEYDYMTPLVHQKLLFDRLPGKKELHIIKGAPHTFVEPEHLREVKHIVRQWISRIGYDVHVRHPIGLRALNKYRP